MARRGSGGPRISRIDRPTGVDSIDPPVYQEPASVLSRDDEPSRGDEGSGGDKGQRGGGDRDKYFNCCACVIAVLYNQLARDRGEGGVVLANDIASRFPFGRDTGLSPEDAMKTMQEWEPDLHPESVIAYPGNPVARAGHYAVFDMTNHHVIYGFRSTTGSFQLWDPTIERPVASDNFLERAQQKPGVRNIWNYIVTWRGEPLSGVDADEL